MNPYTSDETSFRPLPQETRRTKDRGIVIEDYERPRLPTAVRGTFARRPAVELVCQNAANLLINAESCAELLRKMDAAAAGHAVAGWNDLRACGNSGGDLWCASVIPAPTPSHQRESHRSTHGQQRNPS